MADWKKAAGWLSDNFGAGKLDRGQKLTFLQGDWQHVQGELPTISLRNDDISLRGTTYTLTQPDGYCVNRLSDTKSDTESDIATEHTRWRKSSNAVNRWCC